MSPARRAMRVGFAVNYANPAAMRARSKSPLRNAVQTKARIVDAARAAFAEQGYPQTGMREIAMRAKVATSLVTKHFETKANLFEVALINALEVSRIVSLDRSEFAERLVGGVSNPATNIGATAMIALSLGDEGAREIISRVTRDYIIGPLSEWIGPPDARARAANLFMLSIGFTIFSRHMDAEPSARARERSRRWVSRALQDVIERSD